MFYVLTAIAAFVLGYLARPRIDKTAATIKSAAKTAEAEPVDDGGGPKEPPVGP